MALKALKEIKYTNEPGDEFDDCIHEYNGYQGWTKITDHVFAEPRSRKINKMFQKLHAEKDVFF